MSEDAHHKDASEIGGWIFVAIYFALNLVILYIGWDGIREASTFWKTLVSLVCVLMGLPVFVLIAISSFLRRRRVPVRMDFGPPAA